MKKQLTIPSPPLKETTVTSEQSALLQAHANSSNGLRLGVQKSKRRGHLDTPLFAPLAGDQKELF